MNEMTTLASIGDLPALPMGMSYPKKKGWLLGPVRKSKKLKFKRVETVKLMTVPGVSEFFEVLDPKMTPNPKVNPQYWSPEKSFKNLGLSSPGQDKPRSGKACRATNLFRKLKVKLGLKSEAVDPLARANRLIKIWKYGRKKGQQADRLYSKHAGYRKDRSSNLPPDSLDIPLIRRAPMFKGNRYAAGALSDYAKEQEARAFKLFDKFRIRNLGKSRISSIKATGIKQIASNKFKARKFIPGYYRKPAGQ